MVHLLLQLTIATSALGDGGSAELRTAATYRGSDDDVLVETPAVADARISVDGNLDEPVWSQAALLEAFTQFEPVEGVPASQNTEVLVLVDQDAIYFAVRAFDDDPAGIRATLSERDTYGRSDDYVRFVLDTFDDQRRAYVFTVNPLGVQHDGLWNEGGGSSGRRGGGRGGNMGEPIDDNPDFLWDSDARIADWGYQVEIRVPFKSLRFPDRDEQSWGLQVVRKVQRNGFQSSWAPITKDASNRLALSGKLTGLRNLDAGLFMEINPVLTGSRTGAYDETAGAFVREDPTADFGLNATYGVTSNLTLDATYNPDFSQVEADAGQISVNERFALFFPEKRPFFLEGTEVFGMARQLVYTRSVANPIAGAKLSGKVGSLNVGYLGAVDEAFDAGDPKTVVNLLRVRQDVGQSSTLGAVYTDRTVGADDYNRVVGGDTRLVLGQRNTVTLLGAASFTGRPGVTGREDGRLLYGQFERAGRELSFSAELEDTDPGFDAGSGFFNRVGDTQLQSRLSYNWYGAPGSLLEQIGPFVNVNAFWDHDDFWDGRGLEEADVRTGVRFSFKDNVTIWGNFTRSMYSYGADAYQPLFVQQTDGSLVPFRPDPSLFDGLHGVTVSLWVSKWERIRGNVRYTVSEEAIFDRSYDVAVAPARSRSGDVTLNLYPTRALAAEVGIAHSRLAREGDGVEHSSAIIPRVQARYQFSRAFFVRGIFEYASEERVSLRDPVTGFPLVGCEGTECELRAGSRSHDFHVEGLVAYEPSPGTVFYVGYTREMEDPEAFGFRRMRSMADGLFVKLSYRFRM